MTDLDDQDHQRLVANLLNNPVVADANTIHILRAGKFVATGRTRYIRPQFLGQLFQGDVLARLGQGSVSVFNILLVLERLQLGHILDQRQHVLATVGREAPQFVEGFFDCYHEARLPSPRCNVKVVSGCRGAAPGRIQESTNL